MGPLHFFLLQRKGTSISMLLMLKKVQKELCYRKDNRRLTLAIPFVILLQYDLKFPSRCKIKTIIDKDRTGTSISMLMTFQNTICALLTSNAFCPVSFRSMLFSISFSLIRTAACDNASATWLAMMS